MKRIHASAGPLRAVLSALLLGTGALQLAPVWGQATPTPPERMTYQGYLAGSDGAALGTPTPKNYDVIFKIYADQSSGAVKWAEQQTVTVDNGYFSALLGEGASTGDPRPDLSTLFKGADASERYVGITVKGIGAGGANVDILPRLRLLTSPYAYLARNAVQLVQNNGADLLTSSGNLMTLTGSLDITTGNSVEFGSNAVGKQGDAGRIGYQLFSQGLDIVGAGTNGTTRKVTIWSEGGLTVNGPVSATSYTGNGALLTGVATLGANTFNGTQTVTGGGLRMDNAQIIAGKNSAGTYENFLWPRWIDNFTYFNYGSAGLRMRNNTDAITLTLGNNNSAVFGAAVYARGGYPGGNNSGNNGYAFAGNGGDNDSGMFSDTDGYVRIVSNSADRLTIRPDDVYVHSRLTAVNGVTVDTGYGRTLEVAGYWLRVLDANSKAKYADWWRDANSMRFEIGGGTSQGGAATRYVTYDGDSNWDFSSDRKLKKDIVNAEPMLERALKVQVRRYRWKDEASEAKHKLGVIAQEVQPLFPDLVSEQTNKDGDQSSLAVGYGDFALIAVKAIQELKQQHDAEMADLKRQVAELASIKLQMTEMKAQLTEVLKASSELRVQAEKAKVTAAVGR